MQRIGIFQGFHKGSQSVYNGSGRFRGEHFGNDGVKLAVDFFCLVPVGQNLVGEAFQTQVCKAVGYHASEEGRTLTFEGMHAVCRNDVLQQPGYALFLI